jgi:Uma2 family endonuclease
LELVDGTLVEKAVGVEESKLTVWLLGFLHNYLLQNPIGELTAPDGYFRLGNRLVRAPDITFTSWDSTSSEAEDRVNPIANTVPDLTVEVVSPSNTTKEMNRKRKEYFKAGTSLVWQIYPRSRTVEVYTSPNRWRTLTIDDTLDGGKLLPGFTLPLRTLFGRPTKESRRRHR